MSKMMPDDEPVQTPWVDRWAEIEPTSPPLVARWVDIDQVTPPPRGEPPSSFRGVILVLVFTVIAITLAVIEVLFRVALGPPRSSRNSFKKTVLL